MVTKGEWQVDNAYGVDTKDGGLIVESRQDGYTKVIAMINAQKEAEANANIIVTAVNACKKVNPDPQAVAEAIPDAFLALIWIKEAIDNQQIPRIPVSIKSKVWQVLAKAEGR